MEKYCPYCGRVYKEENYKFCPNCSKPLKEREGRQYIGHLRHEVFKRDNYTCVECGATNKEKRLEIDHIIPIAKGGTNDLNNLQTLCWECNQNKNTDIWTSPKNMETKDSYNNHAIKIYKKTSRNKLRKEINSLNNSDLSELCKNLEVPSDITKRNNRINYILKNYSYRTLNDIVFEIQHIHKLKQLGINSYKGPNSDYKENKDESFKKDPRVLKLAIKYGNEEKYKDEIEEYRNKLQDLSSKGIQFEDKLQNLNDKGIDVDLISKKIICPKCGKKILFAAYDIHHKCTHCSYKF